ncbi:serine/threonine-protein kinase, partial [Actinoallomurus acaciae]
MTRVLAGRYRLSAQLGRGGMGAVWRADDQVLGRTVAVKELSLPTGITAERRAALCERAIREARVSSRLRHESIIGVHDVIAEDDRPWIVMELLAGRALDEAGPLPPHRVAEIGLAVLDALGVAHAEGVLHRDVKPGNIFLCDDGRVVLTDFGIATLAGDVSLTASGGLVGSPGYMAPERLRGDTAGPPSDLWSLGATLYAAAEGRSPFARRTVAGTLSAVLTEEPAPPHRSGPLGPLLMAMLARDPAHRPPPDAIRAFLRRVAGGEAPA